MICAVAFALALVVPAGPQRASASPITWDALQVALPSDSGARTRALLRFAHDNDPPLADRIKAAKAAHAALPATDTRRVDTSLLLATLHGIEDKPKDRRAALVGARALAKKKGLEKARRLDEAINGEDALAVLVKLLAKRAKVSAASAAGAAGAASVASELENKAAGVVEGALPAWLAIGDERQHGLARIALAEKTRLDGDPAKAERTLSDAVDALAAERDTAGVRAEGWRALSRLFAAGNRWEEAASAALASDRAAADDPKRTSSREAREGNEGPRYVRTAETARVCKQARGNGVACAKIEKQRWGDRTFFDFAAAAPASSARAPFDSARADDVLAEYESELHECLKQGAKSNLTNDTHVEMVWTIGNDGRVPPTADINPLRLRGTVVESCVRKAFTLFRYPPYAGELQHVRLGFDVGS